MFIYMLICAELALLFTVFWYLYVRQPGCNHRIRGDMWGDYDENYQREVSQSWRQWDDCSQFSVPLDEADLPTWQGHDELVFDRRSGHYVTEAEIQGPALVRLAVQLDRTLSRLNVRH